MTRYRCSHCDAVVDSDDLLIGVNPFDPTTTIEGCPVCRAPFEGRQVCDVAECGRDATCGTPTQSGYRLTCWEHRPGKP